MSRPLKYGEKTSVRSITIPDSMWEALPEPRSQWTVEAVRQFLAPQREFGAAQAEPEGAPMQIVPGPEMVIGPSEVPTSETIKALTEAVKNLPPVPETATGAMMRIEAEEERARIAEMSPEAVQALVDTLPEPIRSEVPKQDCVHPKQRQVNVIGGKKCLDCGKVKGIQGTWA